MDSKLDDILKGARDIIEGVMDRRIDDVIKEAWRQCRARYAAFVGPEPARWRFSARSEWRQRQASADFLSPSRTDIIDAAYHLGAIELIPKLMDAYASAHREAGAA